MTYYYKKDSDTYHWHYKCHLVPLDVETNSEWVVTDKRPTDREQCNHCKKLD